MSEAVTTETVTTETENKSTEDKGGPDGKPEGQSDKIFKEDENKEVQKIDDNSGGKEAGSEAKPAEEKKDEEKKEVAPEKKEVEHPADYDLKLPESSSLDQAHVDEIAEFSKKQGLSKDQAQAYLDRESTVIGEVMQNAQKIVEDNNKAAMETASEQWKEELKNDTEIGGDKANESAELSKRFTDAYFPEELKTWLDETGMGNHPGVIKGFRKAALDLGIGDDKVVKDVGRIPKRKSDADLFYPKEKSGT